MDGEYIGANYNIAKAEADTSLLKNSLVIQPF